ncbi:stage II sporulation protein E [Oceanispirochaeta crateris]|uniref:Stage II sporulation protein E n=1 Tax=Oceanispirochaeta crateris TaxID=2518645 RepID=A0A5C1QRQ0_9SPIO|nr:SpoIIE family protein phosphatase [Oceanispirochaeta crateris]QEN08762.1 stage II sporulation protein E [Oceanispirochaeta crateris]
MIKTFFDVGYFQITKKGESAPGDAFLTQKAQGRQRVISVLSDGLGSGIRANVLSTLTATMALRSIENNLPPLKTAELISRTLPVCSIRKISYSTFTIVDVDEHGLVQIAEYDNPHFVLIRDGQIEEPESESFSFKTVNTKRNIIRCSSFQAVSGDRLVFFSDGVTQSGLGMKETPLGWGDAGARQFLLTTLVSHPEYSSSQLSKALVRESLKHDVYSPKDDITCGSLYFRNPRQLMIATGPPYDRERDKHLAGMISGFDGTTIISGGTTANIIARELGRNLTLDLGSQTDTIPPCSTMEGVDLVTEGIITMSRVHEYLEKRLEPVGGKGDPAERIVKEMINSDVIHFMVGTRINEAHQDPNMPVALEIRRNLIISIANTLEKLYFKEVLINYI